MNQSSDLINFQYLIRNQRSNRFAKHVFERLEKTFNNRVKFKQNIKTVLSFISHLENEEMGEESDAKQFFDIFINILINIFNDNVQRIIKDNENIISDLDELMESGELDSVELQILEKSLKNYEKKKEQFMKNHKFYIEKLLTPLQTSPLNPSSLVELFEDQIVYDFHAQHLEEKYFLSVGVVSLVRVI
jgi:hypothetical protein